MRTIISSTGYTLIEIVIVVVILGTLIIVANIPLQRIVDERRREETKNEMQYLAHALAGDRSLRSGGVRTSFGYIGDIGSLPARWEDLVTNPGLATWKGPYILDKFRAGSNHSDYKVDAWGKTYSRPDRCSFSSTGGPDTLTIRLARSINELLYNRVCIVITDLRNIPPGNENCDSVLIRLSYPDGIGGFKVVIKKPAPNGLAVFDSVPIGLHRVSIIFPQTPDTIVRKINIEPGLDYYEEVRHFTELW